MRMLTPKEEMFVRSYLIDFNGARAARAAGYSEKTSREMAYELLTKPHVQEAVMTLRQEMAEKFNITRERIAQEYARIGFLDSRKLYDEDGNPIPIHKLGDDEAAAIAGLEIEVHKELNEYGDIDTTVTKKIKISEKKAALDSLVKLMGYAAPDKIAATTPDGKAAVLPPITVNIVPPVQSTE